MSDGRVLQEIAEKPSVLERSRALVFVDRRLKPRCLVRAQSDFVAQLIACTLHLGEHRRWRREEPSVGLDRYRVPNPRAPSDFEIEV